MKQRVNQIALIITFVIGTLMVADYYVKAPILNDAMAAVRDWMPMMTALAALVGVASILAIHGSHIVRKRSGWLYSVVFWGFVLATFGVGMFTSKGTSDATYRFLYDNMLVAAVVTMTSMTAFFIASAAFRAFRASSLEAAFLLGAAAIVMLGRIPIGDAISAHLPLLADWIMNVPNMAGQRGFLIANGIGFIAISLRVILGMSRSHLRSE